MNFFKHIFLVFAAAMILLPTAMSFSHIFSGHEHIVCDNYADEHFHTKSLDCELHKFQKNPALEISFLSFVAKPDDTEKKTTKDYYQFLSDHQNLPFELRGPPLA